MHTKACSISCSTRRTQLTIPIERIRALLGPEADGKTNEQLKHLAEDLDNAASTFYDQIQDAWKRDPESVRWIVHSIQTGEHEDESQSEDYEENPGWRGIE
jgi:hypothetical protein